MDALPKSVSRPRAPRKSYYKATNNTKSKKTEIFATLFREIYPLSFVYSVILTLVNESLSANDNAKYSSISKLR